MAVQENDHEVDAVTLLRRLRSDVAGLVSDDPGDIALYTSDASNYRAIPLAVVVPRSVDDVVAAVAAANSVGAPVVPRGAGTSMAGNAIGGVVIDCSRHVNRIVDIDVAGRTARVEPGVVLTDLTAAVAEHGLTFGPDPSSANRCTLGGMIGNNACGSRSVAWGTTADNVEDIDALLYDGTRLVLGRTGQNEWRQRAASGGRVGEIFSALERFLREQELVIQRRCSGLRRRVSGYGLEHLLPERGRHLARAIVGTEGTCATILGATLRLVPMPAGKALLVLGFPDTVAAADAVPAILPHGPLTVEGINHELVARLPASTRRGPGVMALPDGSAWLLVEVGADSTDEADGRAREIVRDVRSVCSRVTSTVVTDSLVQSQLWQVRTDGAGLATRMPDGSEAWGGWEDAAVDPAQLGSYLRKFDALVSQHGYRGLVYGHFGEGCLHVRIDFDLLSDRGVSQFRRFVEQAADLVIEHGGSVSGEHGDGRARSELLQRMYGVDGVEAFQQFKSIWDPRNRMNPGVIVDPIRIDEGLRNGPLSASIVPAVQLAYAEDDGDFARAMRRCVGVGKCRRDSGGVMCPSYQVTKEERHSTRGRAHVLWEMLQGEVITDGWRSTEVRDALDLCLSCKACKSECPANVDMATYKAEFVFQHYRRRVRPASHYSMGWLPLWAKMAAMAPGLVNWIAGVRPAAALVKRFGGIAPERDLPRFAKRRAVREFRSFSSSSAGTPILLWPDTFSTYFQPDIGKAAVDVLEAAGFSVRLPERTVCCGLTWISTGQLGIARKVLRHSLETVRDAVEAGMPIVGLEPSCTAVFRGDLAELLPEHDLVPQVANQTRTLSELLVERAPEWARSARPRKALVQTHCHQHAVMGFAADRKVMAAAGIEAIVPDAGCCGLAGNFGFEREHFDVSTAAGERVLLPAVRAADDDTVIIADGFSCRTQIAQGTGREAVHLAQVLRRALEQRER